jgi:hypothetical protein
MKEEDVTPANFYAVRRMPLCHSNEIMKDPRDKPRQPASSRRMTARDVAAWVAVAAVAVAAVAVAVGW